MHLLLPNLCNFGLIREAIRDVFRNIAVGCLNEREFLLLVTIEMEIVQEALDILRTSLSYFLSNKSNLCRRLDSSIKRIFTAGTEAKMGAGEGSTFYFKLYSTTMSKNGPSNLWMLYANCCPLHTARQQLF